MTVGFIHADATSVMVAAFDTMWLFHVGAQGVEAAYRQGSDDMPEVVPVADVPPGLVEAAVHGAPEL